MHYASNKMSMDQEENKTCVECGHEHSADGTCDCGCDAETGSQSTAAQAGDEGEEEMA